MENEQKKKKCQTAIKQMKQVEYLLDKIADKLIKLHLYSDVMEAYHEAHKLLFVDVLSRLEEYEIYGDEEND